MRWVYVCVEGEMGSPAVTKRARVWQIEFYAWNMVAQSFKENP